MSRIVVVLHRPIYPRNVGMCARAMGNMDAARLVVVAPQCDLQDEATKQGAAHAQSFLRDATVYTGLQEFLASEGDGIRIALSGRDGLLSPDFLDHVLDRHLKDNDHPLRDQTVPIYLMFGPEDYGLSNEEMALCHHICRLPNFGEILSLNLSHAVLLALYVVQNALIKAGVQADSRESGIKTPALAKTPTYYPSDSIKNWLEALGFDLSAKRVSIEKTLNRILLSRSPSSEELRVIDSVLQQTIRKLRR